VSKHHVYHAIHHKFTSKLPRCCTTNSRNPAQKHQQKAQFPPPATPEKKYSSPKFLFQAVAVFGSIQSLPAAISTTNIRAHSAKTRLTPM
jgi:hypothetical protein